MQIIFISRGRKYLAPLLGFVEVLIWITVVSQIIGGARNIIAYLAYAVDFAAGNYVGMVIENKLAIGTLVRVILSREGIRLVDHLREARFGVTQVDGHEAKGPVLIIYAVVMRKELGRVTEIIEQTVPRSLFTVEELRSVREGVFPDQEATPRQNFFGRQSK